MATPTQLLELFAPTQFSSNLDDIPTQFFAQPMYVEKKRREIPSFFKRNSAYALGATTNNFGHFGDFREALKNNLPTQIPTYTLFRPSISKKGFEGYFFNSGADGPTYY